MEWKDITLNQYKKVVGLNPNDIEDNITATEVILGINADDMTFGQFANVTRKLDFLKEPMPKVIIRKSYTLNGRLYDCNPSLNELTVSQYIDFSNFSKSGLDEIEKVLAVVIIPSGQKYGEYDMEQVYSDILTMSIVDVFAVLNFFIMQFKLCTKALEDFLIKNLRGRKNKPVREAIQAAISASMECCSLSGL